MKNPLIYIVIFFSTLLCYPAFAQTMPVHCQKQNLSKVSFQLSEEQWATTKTAKVIVGVNAVLSNSQLGQMQSQILGKLKKIYSNTAWHITTFNRSKDRSGLERLTVVAQARIPETGLVNLRKQAKSVSNPGETYTITNIQFTPSPAEVEKVRSQLRTKIYTKAKSELAQLNNVFPNSKFYLHNIVFGAMSSPYPVQKKMMYMARSAGQPSQASLSVSNKVQVNANVVLASNANSK